MDFHEIRIFDIIYKFNSVDILENYINSLSLGGNGNIIKIDESKFGKRKYNKRHYVGGV